MAVKGGEAQDCVVEEGDAIVIGIGGGRRAGNAVAGPSAIVGAGLDGLIQAGDFDRFVDEIGGLHDEFVFSEVEGTGEGVGGFSDRQGIDEAGAGVAGGGADNRTVDGPDSGERDAVGSKSGGHGSDGEVSAAGDGCSRDSSRFESKRTGSERNGFGGGQGNGAADHERTARDDDAAEVGDAARAADAKDAVGDDGGTGWRWLR